MHAVRVCGHDLLLYDTIDRRRRRRKLTGKQREARGRKELRGRKAVREGRF